MLPSPLLRKGTSIHFIGIGGVGMSGVAHVCHAQGMAGAGCDVRTSTLQRTLQQQGISVHVGHHPSHLTREVDLAVYSQAVSPDAVERQEAKALGIPLIS